MEFNLIFVVGIAESYQLSVNHNGYQFLRTLLTSSERDIEDKNRDRQQRKEK